MRWSLALTLPVICGAVLSGCLAPTIVTATRPPKDDTIVSPRLTPKGRVMVIPPSGTVRGQYDSEIALFEREFLRGGITVISGAVTGRVLLDPNGQQRGDAASLSDAERALIMAKQTGADAILQIGQLTWSETSIPSRFFICCRSGERGYSEVSQPEYDNWTGKKAALASHVLTFVGRLMDVQTGEVLASFKFTAAANFNLPGTETVRFGLEKRMKGTGRNMLDEKWDEPLLADVNWEVARRVTTEKVIEAVAQKLMARLEELSKS